MRTKADLVVGPLIVRKIGHLGFTIYEAMSGLRVARGFPTAMHAANAAKEMNEVADWLGILKQRAEGGRPNCEGELRRIAESYGGYLRGGARAVGQPIM